MSAAEYAVVAAVLISFSLGSFAGHAIGYGKGVCARGPRRARRTHADVRTPE